MLWIRWAFIAANVIYSFAWIRWTKNSPQLNLRGKISMGSVGVWQLIGVALVIWLNLSAWHLLWWLPLGYLLNIAAVRIMYRLGYGTTN